jgi:Superinfection immunity protein
MQGLENSYAFWIFVFVALVVVYLLPTLIGMIRGVDRLALVFLVNLIGAPTGVGWFAAMILAFGPRRLPPEPSWPSLPGGMYAAPGTLMPGPRDVR